MDRKLKPRFVFLEKMKVKLFRHVDLLIRNQERVGQLLALLSWREIYRLPALRATSRVVVQSVAMAIDEVTLRPAIGAAS